MAKVTSLSFTTRREAKHLSFDIKRKTDFLPTFFIAIVATIFSTFILYRKVRLSFGLPHLTQMMNLYSENAFYYSFYVDFIGANSIREAFYNFFYDRRTEYPSVINAFQRFNIIQEIILGWLWRVFFNFFFSTPYNFYAVMVLILNGIGIGILVTISSVLGSSILCGICAFGFFIINHKKNLILRISFIPLRENFGLPFLWLNILIIILIYKFHKKKKNDGNHSEPFLLCCLLFSSLCLILVWQFGVFILSTQCASIFGILLLGYDVECLTKRFFYVYTLAYILALVILCFPKYLLLSIFPQILLTFLLVLYLCPADKRELKEKNKSLIKVNVCRGFLSIFILSIIICGFNLIEKDDSHVFMLLKAKLNIAPHTFDSIIYLMGGHEFDFFSEFFYNLILPSKLFQIAILMSIVYVLFFIKDRLNELAVFSYASINQLEDNQEKDRTLTDCSENKNLNSNNGNRKQKNINEKAEKIVQNIVSSNTKNLEDHADFAFFLIQACFFLCLMLLIARLRVLCLPMLCILDGTLASFYIWSFLIHQIFSFTFNLNIFSKSNIHLYKRAKFFLKSFCVPLAILPFMLNIPWEELEKTYEAKHMMHTESIAVVNWLNKNMDANTPILTDIPMGGTVRAATKLSTIIHPHYENLNLRKRVQFMYAIFACPPLEEYSKILKEIYKVDHILLPVARCTASKSLKGISLSDVLEKLEDQHFICHKNTDALKKFCFRMQLENTHFDVIYLNGKYAVLKRKAGMELVKSTPYSQFKWKKKANDISSWNPWIERCIANDDRCALNICDYARQLIDIYSLPDAARILYNRALELYPNDKDVLFHYAEYLDYDLKKPNLAQHYYKKAVYADLSNFKKIIDYTMFLDQAIGRKPSYNEIIKLLIELSIDLKSKNIKEFDYTDAEYFCKAATQMNAFLQDKNLNLIDSYNKILESEKIYWTLSKKLNIQNSCLTENWKNIEGYKKSKMEILMNFFFY